MRLLIRFFCWFGRRLLSLRYKIEVRGKEQLTHKHLDLSEGVLFLPNHPAILDPLILVLYFWPRFSFRPLVIEYIYRTPGLYLIMKWLKALPVPNFESSVNELKLKQAEESMDAVVEGLRKKQAFLLYPSGRVKHTGKEVIGGASAVHSLLQKAPQANLVLVRTTGLWGSIFSRAYTSYTPLVRKTAIRSFGILLKNLIFFAPRRRIVLEIETNPLSFPRTTTRVELNRYLEKWYNQYPTPEGDRVEEEPLMQVSHHFLFSKFPKQMVLLTEKKAKESRKKVPLEIRQAVFQELAQLAQKPVDEIEESQQLAIDLGLDSLNLAHLIAYLGEHYSVKEVYPEQLQTVQDVLQVAIGEKESYREEEVPDSFAWPEEGGRPSAEAPCGRTIPEAFLISCRRMGDFAACADNLVGVVSYKKLKLMILVLAEKFRAMPGKHIAILLPASVGSYLVILAVLFAGKIPVMLNWTLGAKYLKDTLQQTHSEMVISSWRFLERMSYVEFGEITPKIRFLEDIRKKISLGAKAKAFFCSLLPSSLLLRVLKLHRIKEEEPAVILFTSGTETVPKGVPLSHRNLLKNQHGAMQCVRLKQSDTLLGILPPFHSFGFSVAGLFPLLAGVRVAFSPDPTDSFALAKAVDRWKATVICSAPSFLKGLLHVATKQQLKTLTLFVTGAEKTPEELFHKVKALGKNKILIQGYGITECAPILTLNRPNLPIVGVGQPIPGVEIRTIHPETKVPLPEGKEGEICVRGPNVFAGYLGEVGSPFIEIEGKMWYRTGDLGYIEEKGNLILSGRIKRFTKIGGEMISLGSIEDGLNQAFPIGGDKIHFAACASEEKEGTSLIVFTTESTSEKEMNRALKEAGFSRLVKIQRAIQLDEIPLTGTGKIDYRKLQSMIHMGKA